MNYLIINLFIGFFFLSNLFSKELKTLVLIIASDDAPLYVEHQRLWKEYMNSDPDHFKCYFLKGDLKQEREVKISEDTIWCKLPESAQLPGLLDKTILALESIENLGEYDYVFRTNLSSFINFHKLHTYLTLMPRFGCYSGLHHGKYDVFYPRGWVCGAGIILSKDLAEVLVDNKDKVLNMKLENGYNIDDVAISCLMADYNIPIISSPTIEIYNLDTWEFLEKNLTLLSQAPYFHYRIKLSDCDRLLYESMIKSKLINLTYSKG